MTVKGCTPLCLNTLMSSTSFLSGRGQPVTKPVGVWCRVDRILHDAVTSLSIATLTLCQRYMSGVGSTSRLPKPWSQLRLDFGGDGSGDSDGGHGSTTAMPQLTCNVGGGIAVSLTLRPHTGVPVVQVRGVEGCGCHDLCCLRVSIVGVVMVIIHAAVWMCARGLAYLALSVDWGGQSLLTAS